VSGRAVRIAVVVVVLAGLAAAGGVWLFRPVAVETALATRGTAAEIVYATGTVEPVNWAKVTPVRRGRIVESCDCEGQEVARGDLLFRLDDTESRARVAEMRARLDLAESDLERVTGLFERGVTTRERYDQAQAAVTEYRAAIAALESQLVDLQIRAPLDGEVLRIEGEVGEVAELGEPLAWVGQPQPLLVIAEVNEEEIPLVAVGQGVLLNADAFPGRDLRATVSSITPMGDPELQTYRVRLALPRDTPLLIGMSVDVNIIVREVADALLVPAPAVLGDQVQIVDPEGRLAVRTVEVGIRGASVVEVRGGLQDGARVISPARTDLTEGARVRIAGGSSP